MSQDSAQLPNLLGRTVVVSMLLLACSMIVIPFIPPQLSLVVIGLWMASTVLMYGITTTLTPRLESDEPDVDPRENLKQRYVDGEIGEIEYEQKVERLLEDEE